MEKIDDPLQNKLGTLSQNIGLKSKKEITSLSKKKIYPSFFKFRTEVEEA